MFVVGDWVYLKPNFLNAETVDTQRGIVIDVEDHVRSGQLVTVDWEIDRTNDGNPWRSAWLCLV